MSEPGFALQARKVLRRLIRGAVLRRQGQAYLIGGKRGPRAVLTPDLVRSLCDQGWLAERDGGVGLTQAGRAWAEQKNAPDDRFGAQHQVLETRLIEDEHGRERYVVVNTAESPLGYLFAQGLITPAQFQAGERLRRDYTMAHLAPRMGIDYAAPVVRGTRGPYVPIADTALDARKRFNDAMTAAGPGLNDVLFDVCCYLKGLHACEEVRRWPKASAKIVLRIALDRLAGHYGCAQKRRAATRAWRAEK